MFTRIETNRLQTNGDYKNTVDSLAVRAQVDKPSGPSSDAEAVKAGFGLYQSQNTRVEHSVLREQPQYLLVDDKKKTTPTPPKTDSHNVDVSPHVEVETGINTDITVNFGSCSLNKSGTETEDDTPELVIPVTNGGKGVYPAP